MEMIKASEFARRLGISKPAVSRMVKIGRVDLVGGRICWETESAKIKRDSVGIGHIGIESKEPIVKVMIPDAVPVSEKPELEKKTKVAKTPKSALVARVVLKTVEPKPKAKKSIKAAKKLAVVAKKPPETVENPLETGEILRESAQKVHKDAENQDEKPAVLSDRERYVKAKADSEEQDAILKRIKVEEARGVLVPRDTVRTAIEAVAGYVKAALFGSTERICAELAGMTDPDAINSVLRREFGEVMREMHDGFIKTRL